MAGMGLQLAGIALSVIGLICTILCCALPMWRVTAFIGANIITAQVFWEGLWMDCVFQNTGQLQCKVYDSLLALSSDLQAARALVVITIVVAFLALLISIVGAECSNCVEDEGAKSKISIVAGAVFILAGILILISVSWSANTIIRDFYNPLIPDALKRELGASLYLGWASSIMFIFGGALLCCSCPPKEKKHYPVTYKAMRAPTTTSYALKNYV
ncbi:claudin-3-like [Rhinatrema bivittatum]|uniref:claudin-3-like n=1 Tax=Rhinatrema bivittatum TaxID=194408 RepID=UPI00112817B9|nr:claudin-3-like [Rhinatrema bivittatum]XP_029468714.1 claudin-3-like [Rhinatrema bivittatum]XP_029468715.1 claudin-3-like [Rhinatrema bivittatum]XP_029468716.1 claudin-3-like [Rhinatrema bivittatum]XP_029468717.1 claudin-3-like [Rhinatrema bivittatum]